MSSGQHEKNLNSVDPAICILSCVILSCAIACLTSPEASAAALLASLFMLGLNRPRPGRFLKSVTAMNCFVLFMWATVPFFMQTDIIWRHGVFTISKTGIRLCLVLTLKANAILFVFQAFVGNFDLWTFGTALTRLHFPHQLAAMLFLMDRNLAALARQWKKLDEALKLHGFAPGTSIHAYKVLAAKVGLLFLGAFRHGKTTYEALLLAGFNGRLPFSSKMAFTMRGAILLGGCVLLSSGLLWLNFFYHG